MHSYYSIFFYYIPMLYRTKLINKTRRIKIYIKSRQKPEPEQEIIITYFYFHMTFYIYKVYIKSIIQMPSTWLFVKFSYVFLSKTPHSSFDIITYFLGDLFPATSQKSKKVFVSFEYISQFLLPIKGIEYFDRKKKLQNLISASKH